ncbi:MAG: hypothetical protein ABIQ11_01035, partial [Saprospiraceae bacterium]
MKTTFLTIALFVICLFQVTAQVQYAVVTTVESIVPAGLGRSRMISNKEDLNTANFTTERIDGKTSQMG